MHKVLTSYVSRCKYIVHYLKVYCTFIQLIIQGTCMEEIDHKILYVLRQYGYNYWLVNIEYQNEIVESADKHIIMLNECIHA